MVSKLISKHRTRLSRTQIAVSEIFETSICRSRLDWQRFQISRVTKKKTSNLRSIREVGVDLLRKGGYVVEASVDKTSLNSVAQSL